MEGYGALAALRGRSVRAMALAFVRLA